jgi:hypothetical protein
MSTDEEAGARKQIISFLSFKLHTNKETISKEFMGCSNLIGAKRSAFATEKANGQREGTSNAL